MLQTELQETSQDLETKADTCFVFIVWATQKCLLQIHIAHSIAAEYTFHCTHRMFSKTDYVRSQYKSEETWEMVAGVFEVVTACVPEEKSQINIRILFQESRRIT